MSTISPFIPASACLRERSNRNARPLGRQNIFTREIVVSVSRSCLDGARGGASRSPRDQAAPAARRAPASGKGPISAAAARSVVVINIGYRERPKTAEGRGSITPSNASKRSTCLRGRHGRRSRHQRKVTVFGGRERRRLDAGEAGIQCCSGQRRGFDPRDLFGRAARGRPSADEVAGESPQMRVQDLEACNEELAESRSIAVARDPLRVATERQGRLPRSSIARHFEKTRKGLIGVVSEPRRRNGGQ